MINLLYIFKISGVDGKLRPYKQAVQLMGRKFLLLCNYEMSFEQHIVML